MGYTNIIKFINNMINNITNISHIDNLRNIILELNSIYNNYICITYGMALDPYKSRNLCYIDIYDKKTYILHSFLILSSLICFAQKKIQGEVFLFLCGR
jgi:hypothetical protein